MRHALLMDALNDIALIHTAFETLKVFPADDPIREDMRDIVMDARHNLLRRFNDLCEGIQEKRADYQIDCEKFRADAVQMMMEGVWASRFNGILKLRAFEEGDTPFYYRVEGIEDVSAAREMPAHLFTVELFEDMLQCIRRLANYTDGQAFTQNVYQKFFALYFLSYSADDATFQP